MPGYDTENRVYCFSVGATGHQSLSSGDVRGGVMRVWIASEKLKRSTIRQCSPSSPDAKAASKCSCNCVAKVAMVGCGVKGVDGSVFCMKLSWKGLVPWYKGNQEFYRIIMVALDLFDTRYTRKSLDPRP